LEKNTHEKDNNFIHGNPLWLPIHNLDNVETDAQDDEQLIEDYPWILYKKNMKMNLYNSKELSQG